MACGLRHAHDVQSRGWTPPITGLRVAQGLLRRSRAVAARTESPRMDQTAAPGSTPPSDAGISFDEAVRVWTRVGLQSFGGPAGQIAVMHRILVGEKRWISEHRFLHALNYCMLLPGPEACDPDRSIQLRPITLVSTTVMLSGPPASFALSISLLAAV